MNAGLTLVSAEDGYVVFENVDGDEVLMTPGPLARVVVLWSDFDLRFAWFAAKVEHRKRVGLFYSKPDREEFVVQIRQEIADYADHDVAWCENCEEPTDADEAAVVNGGDAYACPTCYDENYRACDDCGNVVHYEETHPVQGGDLVCSRCQGSNYTWCDECDVYYHDVYSDEHQHSDGCDCESPAQHFTMRNDGQPAIHEDELFTIGLPAGTISDEGMRSIMSLVRNEMYNVVMPGPGMGTEEERVAAYAERDKWYLLAFDVYKMNAQWQTKEGNFTKRLSKLAHKTQGLKLTPEMLSQIGNIARDNSQGAEVQVEMTRNLNLSAEDFYHEDSCWWQSYSESRCSLKNNGGIGMRTFDENNTVQGRAWVMPMRLVDGNLRPTFDSMTPDAFVVFNGYGDLSGYVPARIVAQMAGMTYRKIGFRCSPMYVNGDSGYLVAPESITSVTDSLHLNSDAHSNLFYAEAAATESAAALVNA